MTKAIIALLEIMADTRHAAPSQDRSDRRTARLRGYRGGR